MNFINATHFNTHIYSDTPLLYKVHNVRVPQGHLRVGGANIFQKGAADTVYPLASVSVYFCYLVFFFFSMIIAILCLVYVV